MLTLLRGGLLGLRGLCLRLRRTVLLLLLTRVFAGLLLTLLRGGLLGLRRLRLRLRRAILLLLARVFARLLGLLWQTVGLLSGGGAGLAAAIRIPFDDANLGSRGGISLVHLLDGGGRERAAGGAI